MGDLLAFHENDQPSLSELVKDFLNDLLAENKSRHTLKNYQADLGSFLKVFKGELAQLSIHVLRAYFQRFEGKSPATRARHRASLKSFFHWLVLNDYIQSNPMEKMGAVKIPERQPRPIPEEDLAKILKSIKLKRDRLLFILIAETGIRISEALGIRVDDIRIEAQEITVRGKGNRERTVYLVKTEALRLLRQYLRETGYKKGLLFRPDEKKQRSGRTGLPIHYTTIQQAWQRYCLAVGIKATIHQLRHTYATRLLAQGKPIEVVSKVLGHRRIATTQIYAEISSEQVKKSLFEDS